MTDPDDTTVAFPEDILHHAVFLAPRSPEAAPFLTGMDFYGVDFFIKTMGARYAKVIH